MRFTRLELRAHGPTESPMTVTFDHDIAVLDIDAASSTRVRLALESFFRGNYEFDQAFVTVDDIEIPVSPEMAQHLAHHFGSRGRILDNPAVFDDDEAGGSVDAVSLRAGLETLRVVSRQLDHRTVNTALEAVLADKRALEIDAQSRVSEAAEKRAQAQVALGRVQQWRASVYPIHEKSEAARERSRRRLSGPLSYRRYSALRQEEMEVLESINFQSFEEFEAHADASEARYTEELRQANEEYGRAQRYLASLQERNPPTSRARLLTVSEYVLRLRLREMSHPDGLAGDDQRALHQALAIMLDDGPGFQSGSEADTVRQALARLVHIESKSLQQGLARQALAHAEPLPAVGTIPIIFDGLFDNVEPGAAAEALSALDPYVGTVQIVSLRYEPAIVRWAHRHGVSTGG